MIKQSQHKQLTEINRKNVAPQPLKKLNDEEVKQVIKTISARNY